MRPRAFRRYPHASRFRVAPPFAYHALYSRQERKGHEDRDRDRRIPARTGNHRALCRRGRSHRLHRRPIAYARPQDDRATSTARRASSPWARSSTSNPSKAAASPTRRARFWRCRFRLCELEERLVDVGFVKVARNCLVNLCRIAGLRPYVGGRLLARLDNDEEIVISRKYAGEIRKRLDA